VVTSVAIYGCEGWTLNSKEQKYIDAFEMWCYRRLLRISWTQHKTNEWILRELEVERELLGRVKSLKLSYYGHNTKIRKSGKRINSRMYTKKPEVVVDNADVGQTTSSSRQAGD